MIILIPTYRDISLVYGILENINNLKPSEMEIRVIICRNEKERFYEIPEFKDINIELYFLDSNNLGDVYLSLLQKARRYTNQLAFFHEDDDTLKYIPEFTSKKSSMYLMNYIPVDSSSILGISLGAKINTLTFPENLKFMIDVENDWNCFQFQQMIFNTDILKVFNESSFNFNNDLSNDFKLFIEFLKISKTIEFKKELFFKQSASKELKNISFMKYNKDKRWEQM